MSVRALTSGDRLSKNVQDLESAAMGQCPNLARAR